MPRVPFAKALPEIIEQLLSANSAVARQELIEQTADICNREVISGIADAVNRMAREDLNRAERLAEVTCWLADNSGDRFSRGRIGRAAGNLEVLRGKYADAIHTFQMCIEQFASIGEEIEVAATLSGSLQPLIYLGRYSEALERAREAREIAERHQDDLLLARLDINVGNILHRQDRFSEAVLHYQRALEMLDRVGQKRDCAIAWINLAVGRIALNDFQRAEEAYQKARALAESENMPAIVAQADYNVAYLHYKRGDYTRAIQLYQQTREYCEREEDRYHKALCDLDQAEMYVELHLSQEGTHLAQQAVAAFDSMDMSYEAAKALVWLGIGEHQNRKPFVALDLFSQAQGRMRNQQNAAWVALIDFYKAVVLYQEGRFHEALRSCSDARQFYSSFSASGKAIQVQLLQANIHVALGDLRKAEDGCLGAIKAASHLKEPHLLMQGFALRGHIDQLRGSIEIAINSYQEALQWLEKSPGRPHTEESKLSLSKNRLELYEALTTAMASRPGNEDAPEATFALVEKAKSRELAELLAFQVNFVPSSSRSHSGLVERIRSLRNELNWYYGQMDAAEVRPAEKSAYLSEEMRSRIQELEGRLIKTLGELRSADEQFFVLQNAGTVSTDKIRRSLYEDELIVEFYEAHGVFYVCLVSSEGIRILRTARAETIREMLRSLRSELTKFERVSDRPDAFQASLLRGVQSVLFALYRELIQPIRNDIKGRRLIIVPHGLLHYVPFHALFDGSDYLTEDHIISYAGNASQYYLSSSKKAKLRDGDLYVGTGSTSEPEMKNRRIENVLPGARIVFNETESAEILQQEGYTARFIHVDARFRRRRDNPLFSTFTFGNTVISILDTHSSRLSCSVIGLSGIGPGIDPAGNGNEIHVLAHGLEYAGAETVLQPLWNLTGEPLVGFLETFYGRLCDHGDKPLAFQQTVASIRDEFRHPYYWAPFILRGATGRGLAETNG